MADFVVAVRGLRMAYGSVVVLEDIDLSVSRGEIIAVTGVNGVGKSTLLSCLAGMFPVLRAVTAGQVHDSTLLAQLAVSAAVLGVYVIVVSGSARDD